MGIMDTHAEERQLELLKAVQLAEQKHKKTTYAIMVCLLLMCIISVCVIVGLSSRIRELNVEYEQAMENPIVVSSVNPVIVLDTINDKLEEISELTTIEYLYTDVAIFTNAKQIKNWNIPFTEKSFKIQWDGAIKAGISFEDIRCDFDEKNSRIIVNVPSAKILSYEIFNDTVVVLEENDNVFNKIKLQDRIDFDIANEKEMTERAINNGILDKAQENANKVIKNLIRTIPEADDFEIEFVIEE